MTVRGDEVAARTERARAIGLFRYQLIREAADPQLSPKARGRLVRQIAAREHLDPSGRCVRVSRDTLDRWIRAWRSGGFDALVPSPRQSSPRLPVEVIETAIALKRETPSAPPRRCGGSCVPRWAGHQASGPCNAISPNIR
jgi:putative transposase